MQMKPKEKRLGNEVKHSWENIQKIDFSTDQNHTHLSWDQNRKHQGVNWIYS